MASNPRSRRTRIYEHQDDVGEPREGRTPFFEVIQWQLEAVFKVLEAVGLPNSPILLAVTTIVIGFVIIYMVKKGIPPAVVCRKLLAAFVTNLWNRLVDGLFGKSIEDIMQDEGDSNDEAPRTDESTRRKLDQLFRDGRGLFTCEEDIERLNLQSCHDKWKFYSLAANLRKPGTLHCVSAVSGAGKSSLAAALVRHLRSKGVPVVVHFCKHSSADRKDPVLIVMAMALQLGKIYPVVAKHLLTLKDEDSLEVIDRPEHAVQALLLNPLADLPEGERPPVLLFDALDEADAPDNPTALNNNVLRLVVALRKAKVAIFVTTRPTPTHIVHALDSSWGDAFAPYRLVDLRVDNLLADVPAEMPVSQKRAFENALTVYSDTEGSKIFREVLFELLDVNPSARIGGLSAAYKTFFDARLPQAPAKRLLRVLCACSVPPSVPVLKGLGLEGVIRDLPGSGFLFQLRGPVDQQQLEFLHKSFSEWLQDPRTEAEYLVSPVGLVEGHRELGEYFARLATTRVRELTHTPGERTAHRHVIAHLAAAGAWERLTEVLLNFDFWERVFNLGGLDYALVGDVAAAESAARKGGDEVAAKVAAQTRRWLLMDGRFMRKDPRAVLQRAVAAPISSTLSREARDFYRKPVLELVNPPLEWPSDILTVPLNAAVKSACFSPDGLMLLASAGSVVHILHWMQIVGGGEEALHSGNEGTEVLYVSEPQVVQVKLEPDEQPAVEAALPSLPAAGNADLTYTAVGLNTDRTSAVVRDPAGEWVFSEHIQAQNLLQWVIALPRHADHISALFLRHRFNKDALDFFGSGRWRSRLSHAAFRRKNAS